MLRNKTFLAASCVNILYAGMNDCLFAPHLQGFIHIFEYTSLMFDVNLITSIMLKCHQIKASVFILLLQNDHG